MANASSEFDTCKAACTDTDCEDACEKSAVILAEKCPCRQNCFNGCPCQAYDCRPHTDSASDPVQDKQPVLTTPIDGLSLFQSDEFDSESGLWNKYSGNNINTANYQYENGDLKLLYTETEGVFEGHRQELQYQTVGPHHLNEQPVFGFWEARIKVDAIRNGRSCQFYILPEAYDLNPDDSTTDNTARKGAKIDILNQSVWGANKYNVGVQWDGLEDGTQSTTTTVDAAGLADDYHTFGLLWSQEKLEWYYDGDVVATDTDPDHIPNQERFCALHLSLDEISLTLRRLLSLEQNEKT